MVERRRRLRMIGGGYWSKNELRFTSSNATITPAITLSGDGPCQWEVTESNGAKFYYNANSFSHTRSVAGNMTVRLLNTVQVAQYVTAVDIHGDGIISSVYDLNLSLFRNMTLAAIYSNQLTGDVERIGFSPSVLIIDLGINLLHGNIGSLLAPPNLTALYAANNMSAADLSGVTVTAGLQTLNVANNFLTGLPKFPNSNSFRTLTASGQGATNMTQSRIDAFVTGVYSQRAQFTYATPTFNIGGTNANPSGIYQDPSPNPPSTPLEMIYVLVNDPFAEGFNKQTWTY